MPTVLDATVASSAYDTSGNGGRKLVRLSNGWLVAMLRDNSSNPNRLRFYKSTDNGATWTQLTWISANGAVIHAMASVGTTIHVLYSYTNIFRHIKFEATTVTDVEQTNHVQLGLAIDVNGVGACSLAINEAGTELHATWASKVIAYPNSFNIFYEKGTINANGSVTWGAVEQVTTANTTGLDYKNPVVIINAGNNPVLIFDVNNGTSSNYIGARYWNGTSFIASTVASINGYTQSYPSAIFVPQSINGLPNGRIWVAWFGKNATYSTYNSLYVSYSDDDGATWSSATILKQGSATSDNQNPTITANKSGKVFILFDTWDGSTIDIGKISFSNNAWSSITLAKDFAVAGSNRFPSSLFDLTIDFTEPLFIYKDTAKVGFYGTWTVATISVTPGYIGQKSDKNNLLSYNITTDGTMSNITEKINGTVVNTRTSPTSGQNFTVSLTQEQWDAIKYGKYKDATGGLNTLTIEMGSDIWTYTFDKRLDANADVLSAVKAVQDSQTTFLPAVKAQLGSAIRAKGGTVNDTDAWSAFVSAVNNMTNKRFAIGLTTSDSGGSLTVSGLAFTPKYVIAKMNNVGNVTAGSAIYANKSILGSASDINLYITFSNTLTSNNVTINTNGFSIIGLNGSQSYNWIAFE